jgi:hypothetical protein
MHHDEAWIPFPSISPVPKARRANERGATKLGASKTMADIMTTKSGEIKFGVDGWIVWME